MSLSVAAAPKKRNRLTRAAYQSLDQALLEIAEELQPITVRGLFYQAEVKELVSKDEKGYDLVQRRCLNLRRAGAMPYEWITDNTRWVRRISRYDGPEHFQESMARLYRREYWAHEPFRVEVWIEKDALAGVIWDTVVDEWGIDLYVQKGFSSASYLHSAAETIKSQGKPTHIYVLSDFDPSGKCSLAKIEPGLRRHIGHDVDFWVHDLAVTPAQIRKWKLPSRPTKMKDTRARKFVEQHGDRSVELDAIRPDYLREMVSKAIAKHWSNTHRLVTLKAIEEHEREIIARMAL